MAYKTVSYGSSGEDVKTLQEYLKNNGYNLSVDGQFGSKTQAAVKDYQKKNGLSVDGIVGTNTWGSLSSKTKTTNKAVTNPVSKSTSTAAPALTRPTYTASAGLTAAEKALKEWEAKKPGEYASRHSANIDALLDKVMNGEKFSYNANEDPLFQQYKDMYVKNGKLAMNDTMAEAASLTGGYGSSYGTAAAQQTYQQYLTELNNQIPEFNDRKYQMYLAEKEGDYQKLALLQQMDDAEYAKYREEISDYNTQLGYLYQKKADLSDEEWQKYMAALSNYENDRDFNETVRQYNEQMAYQKERDKVSDEQWERTYNLSKKSSSSGGARSSSGSGSSGSSGSSDSSGNPSDTGDYEVESSFKQTTGNNRFENNGSLFTDSEYEGFKRTVSMYRGNEGRAQLIEDAVLEGKITTTQADNLLNKYGISEDDFKKYRGIK